MWRWLIGLCLALLVVLGTPTPAFAETSADVTVTAIGYVCGAPGDFTLTYISDLEVGISWIKGEDAENTMIRGAVGRPPEDRFDGYLVYYGSGTDCSDTGVSLDETVAAVYYRAWSENAEGGWSPLFAEGNIGGVTVLFLGLLGLAGFLSVFAYKGRFLPLSIAAGMSWMVLGILLLTSPSTIGLASIDNSWIQVLGFIFLIMTVVPLLFQMRTDIRHEEIVRGKKVSWTERGKAPKGTTKSRSKQVQEDYRARLRERGRR